jgi:hypothetical protein
VADNQKVKFFGTCFAYSYLNIKIGAMILNISFNPFVSSLFRGNETDIKFKVMKTTYYTFKLNRIIILISIFLLILSFTVNAQNRSRNGDKNQTQRWTATVERRDNSRNERTTLNYNRQSTTNSNHARYIERNEKPQKQNYTYKSSGYKNEPVHYKQKVYHKKHHYVHVNPHYHKKYYHPSPWTYYNYPVVFYHNNFGEFYYHGGRFYRYDWRYGYIVVDIPTHVYFNTIPNGYRRVYINGHQYYYYKGIYITHTPYGYRIVPRSSGIYISASF